MRRLRLSLLAAAGGVALAATLPAHGQSLVALYESARAFDATYQGARAQYEATNARAAQAKAGLLPQVGLQAAASRTEARIRTDQGTGPRDFIEGKVAMIWHTTGNLTNIKNNVKFPFGVSMLPAHQRRGSPTGGGNFHLFKGANPAQQAASLRFLRWVTSPERAAAWSIATGYVAPRPDAWETPAMKDYVAGFPQAAVARDQLAYAVPELSTHDNQRVAQALTDELQSVLTGKKQPKDALDTAQANATRLLKPFQKS